ncbi:MAG TPA: Smr/MutS family protein [Kofleriaceae bacterium]|nr:Smr/MutS family protein [Kofleriaceae bacterium]
MGHAVRRDADEGGDLFREAVRDATPLADRHRVAASSRPPRSPRSIGASPAASAAEGRPAPRPAGLQIDGERGRAFGVSRKTMRELASGRPPTEATLDLHRHTAQSARERLTRFLTESRAAGLRAVLVITGKGERSQGPERLRDLVPGWFSGPLAPAILAFTPARAEHGGAGALYVLLRAA